MEWICVQSRATKSKIGMMSSRCRWPEPHSLLSAMKTWKEGTQDKHTRGKKPSISFIHLEQEQTQRRKRKTRTNMHIRDRQQDCISWRKLGIHLVWGTDSRGAEKGPRTADGHAQRGCVKDTERIKMRSAIQWPWFQKQMVHYWCPLGTWMMSELNACLSRVKNDSTI